ncbi:hypothetical protein [Methylobacterium oryzisoli]|uniref:hypothetical protein n=1 Tax=Methylobacterium oryzisoli TaxID=3385502 RepID=UPI0038927D23
MKIDRDVLDHLASEVRDEINSRSGLMRIISIDFDLIERNDRFPAYTVRTEGGSAKDRLKLAKHIIEVMGRHMRQLENRYVAAG